MYVYMYVMYESAMTETTHGMNRTEASGKNAHALRR